MTDDRHRVVEPGDVTPRARERHRDGDGPDPRYYVNGVYRPPRRALRPPANWRMRCGFGIAALGFITLIVASIAARTGIFRLSWDRHHMLLQLIAMAICGVGIIVVSTGRPSP